jgi:uncharacterized low-complexity protein
LATAAKSKKRKKCGRPVKEKAPKAKAAEGKVGEITEKRDLKSEALGQR